MKFKSNSSLKDIYKVRNRIPVDELEPVKCENCGHEFKGHFCPNCGQEVAEFNRPFGFVIYDFVGNFFAFDTRFFQTFRFLLFRPGFLTAEFFAGRRMRYSPPFRIFVFLSFILFILLQTLTERGLDATPKLKVTDSSTQVKLNSGLVLKSELQLSADSSANLSPDSLAMFPIEAKDSVQAKDDDDLKFDLGMFGTGKIRDNLNKMADMFEEKLRHTKDPEKQKEYSSYIVMCRAPEMVISNIMKYLSWSFFILLPLFALVLKIFYIRRKQLYVRHLLFSIHLHSFLFFILILVTSLKLIFVTGTNEINLLLLLSFPVYFILAMRKFYGQSWSKVLLKFIGVSLIYNAMLWTAVVLVFIKSIGLT
ncbi:MAG: DUF3667 domain-containing protein [Prolixibacteraceae bacterium]|nr:DUF3667 domain-containing protein [Prolixibacteraceae bacterium]